MADRIDRLENKSIFVGRYVTISVYHVHLYKKVLRRDKIEWKSGQSCGSSTILISKSRIVLSSNLPIV